MNIQNLIKKLEETKSLTRILKNAYNTALHENENIEPKDINDILDLIIEKLQNLINDAKQIKIM